MSTKLYDGAKAVPLDALPEEAWTYLTGNMDDNELYRTTAYLYAVIQKRAGAVREIPRKLVNKQSEEEVKEDEIEQELGLTVDLGSLLFRSSVALDLYAKAYMMAMGDNQGNPKRVRWLHPSTVTYEVGKDGDISHFVRTLKAKGEEKKYKFPYKPKEGRAYPMEHMDSSGGRNLGWNALIWVWGEGLQELGPGLPPADVAKPAAKILRSIDAFQNNFFERGAISQHLIKAGTLPPPAEKERVLAKLRRALFGGNTTAHNVEVVNSDIEVEKLGADPKDLSMGDIDESNQRDISAAFLTSPLLVMPPETINRSALDRIQQDWLLTVIVPHTQLIVKALNKHLFEPMGYMLELDPQSMAVNQEDEKNRSIAVINLVAAGETLANAYRILGYDLPGDYESLEDQAAAGADNERLGVASEEIALNGAQIQSALSIVQSFNQGFLPRENAVFMVETFFNIPKSVAEHIVPETPNNVAEPTAGQVPQPAQAPRPQTPPQPNTGELDVDVEDEDDLQRDLADQEAGKVLAKQEEIGRLRRWTRNRMNGTPPDPEDFDTPLLTRAEKASVIYDVMLEREGEPDGQDTPFPATDGKATRDIPQGDQNPSEAQLRGFEEQLRTSMTQALGELQNALFEGVDTSDVGRLLERLDDEATEPLREAAVQSLEEAALAGADNGREQVTDSVPDVKQTPITVNWELANEDAAEWARQYSYELVSGLTDTTRERLQQEITRFIEEGGTMDDLRERLSPLFNDARAARIAATEVTRAYQAGQEAARRRSIDEGIQLREEVRTSSDGLVCPVCSGVAGTVRDVGAASEHPTMGALSGPPFHVGCRCWTVSVVIE